MFSVRITPRARAALGAQVSTSGCARPGLLVHRAVPAGKPIRLVGGAPAFAWQIASFESYPDEELLAIDGVLVYLALVPRPHEKGIRFALKNGAVQIEETR